MTFFEKITAFFSSAYANDVRFKHSTLALLKLFFERANKLKTSLALLGNVFRNSKWADLSVQNIKVSFVRSTSGVYLALLILFFFVTCFYDFRLTLVLSQFITHYVPFGPEIVVVLFDIIVLFSDISDRATLLIYTILLAVVAFFERFASALQLELGNGTPETETQSALGWLGKHNPSASGVNRKYYKRLTKQSRSRLSPYRSNPKWSGEASTLASLYSSQNNLLGAGRAVESFTGTALVESAFSSAVNHSATSPQESDPFWRPKRFSVVDAGYVTAPDSSSNWSTNSPSFWTSFPRNFSLDTNLGILSFTTQKAPELSLTSFGVLDSLNLAKQDRWLMKNSLLANKLDRQNAAFTQAKSLLCANLDASQLASKNVWLSSKVSQLDPATSGNFALGVGSLLYPNLSVQELPLSTKSVTTHSPELLSIDFFETSRLWLVKKYFYTSNLRSNNYYHFLSPYTAPSGVNPRVDHYSIMVESVQGGLSNQLVDLSPSLPTPTFRVDSLQRVLPNANLVTTTADLDLLKGSNLLFASQLFSSTSVSGVVAYSSSITNTQLSTTPVRFETLR